MIVDFFNQYNLTKMIEVMVNDSMNHRKKLIRAVGDNVMKSFQWKLRKGK